MTEENVDLRDLFECDAGFGFRCGELIAIQFSPAMASADYGPMVVRDRQLVECHGGLSRRYVTRAPVAEHGHLIWHECELSYIPSTADPTPGIMDAAGFKFKVGDVVESRTQRRGESIATARVVTERLLADQAGTVQRFYAMTGPAGSEIVSAIAIEAMERKPRLSPRAALELLSRSMEWESSLEEDETK